MVLSQNLQVHTVGSPLPTFACPSCLRHFKSKGGRTRHIQAKHTTPDPTTRPSPIPTSPQPSLHNTSPVPSAFASPPALPASLDSDIPNFDPDVEDHATPDPTTHPSPQPSFHNTSPIPYAFTSPPASHDIPPPDLDIEDRRSDQDRMPSEQAHENFPPGSDPGVGGQHIPDAIHIERVYHPKLDGMLIFFVFFDTINLAICRTDL